MCNDKNLNKALRYLPLVGIITGSIGAATLYLSSLLLPLNVATILAMISMLLATGALHEDGLADFADGFGAGYNSEMIVRIMKDSHIGTYGVLTLIVATLLKFTLLTSMQSVKDIALAMVAAQAASRLAPVIMLSVSRYVRSENSKSPHSALGVSRKNLLIAAMFGLLPTLLIGWRELVIYVAVAAVLIWGTKSYTERKIGGCTGDTLGALQQVGELLFYITILAAKGL